MVQFLNSSIDLPSHIRKSLKPKIKKQIFK
nr:MAG TPA: hypothetical protein [Caudoviricetes sp.]